MGIEELIALIRIMKDKNASDLHLSPGIFPQLRIDGVLTPIKEAGVVDSNTCHKLIYDVLKDEQKARFEGEKELDIAVDVRSIGRVRMNVYYEKEGKGAALRMIPAQIPPFMALGLPVDIMKKIADSRAGLVLVTGPTGCGKSTTLASIVDYINDYRKVHIVTVEDPIEFLHKHKNSIVHQREVGIHTNSFAKALKYVLRQDPDVILVGEMRDLETISMALTAAETGHLVLATLHTPDAIQSINRIIDVFPPHQQEQVRTQLSFVIQAVFSQILVPCATGRGRVLACERMLANPAIRNLIRNNKMYQAKIIMQGGRNEGMQTMNMALAELCRQGKITREDAFKYSPDPEELRSHLC